MHSEFGTKLGRDKFLRYRAIGYLPCSGEAVYNKSCFATFVLIFSPIAYTKIIFGIPIIKRGA